MRSISLPCVAMLLACTGTPADTSHDESADTGAADMGGEATTVTTTTVATDAGTVSGPADEGSSDGATDDTTTTGSDPSSFDARCNAPGVIRCVGFDDPADIAGTWGDRTGILAGASTPELDTDVKASGASALKFTIPSNSPADTSGAYWANFSDDLATQFGESSTFYVQWRQRFSTEMLTTPFPGGGGFKLVIIGTGDLPGCSAQNAVSIDSGGSCSSSCTPLEVVTTTYYGQGFPAMYNSCSGSASHGPYDGFFEAIDGGNDFKLQNARPAPFCLYTQGHTDPPTFFPPDGNCDAYEADEWMTFQIEITTGPRMGDEWVGSHVRMWIADEGAPSELAVDWGPYNLTASDPAQDLKFGKVWLTPYNTGKDPAFAHAVAYTWVDELVVSTEQIADP